MITLVGMILLGGLSNAAAVQQVDYEARNYYYGDYDDFDVPLGAADDVDVDDDYVITGARRRF